jgi:hypothetical protein
LVDQVADPVMLVDRAIEATEELVNRTPADTFAMTKAQRHREALDRTVRFDDDAEAKALWLRQVTDGWTARYLESAVRR